MAHIFSACKELRDPARPGGLGQSLQLCPHWQVSPGLGSSGRERPTTAPRPVLLTCCALSQAFDLALSSAWDTLPLCAVWKDLFMPRSSLLCLIQEALLLPPPFASPDCLGLGVASSRQGMSVSGKVLHCPTWGLLCGRMWGSRSRRRGTGSAGQGPCPRGLCVG